MSAVQFRLKQPAGWFAAGREVEAALRLLSDLAFKVFLWICLHAERSRGSVCADTAALARALRKPEVKIAAALEELYKKDVCHPVIGPVIEITDGFWPYQRQPARNGNQHPAAYIDRVRHLFLERNCVRSVFNAADQKLAAELYRTGIPIEKVERAILLGSLRKYAALLNHGNGAPITSLHYFTGLLEEVDRLEISPTYWQYVAQKMNTLEKRWRQALQTPDRMETK